MRVLIDTNILIDIKRDIEDAQKCIDFFIEESIHLSISVITAMEFLAGTTSKNELRQTEKFLTIFTVIPISADISYRAIDLFKEYALSHSIDIPDCFIAATALEHGMTLLTLNAKHFSMIKNLQIKKPY